MILKRARSKTVHGVVFGTDTGPGTCKLLNVSHRWRSLAVSKKQTVDMVLKKIVGVLSGSFRSTGTLSGKGLVLERRSSTSKKQKRLLNLFVLGLGQNGLSQNGLSQNV